MESWLRKANSLKNNSILHIFFATISIINWEKVLVLQARSEYSQLAIYCITRWKGDFYEAKINFSNAYLLDKV